MKTIMSRTISQSKTEKPEHRTSLIHLMHLSRRHIRYDLAKATVVEAEYYLAALKGEDIPEDATGSKPDPTGKRAIEYAKRGRNPGWNSPDRPHFRYDHVT